VVSPASARRIVAGALLVGFYSAVSLGCFVSFGGLEGGGGGRDSGADISTLHLDASTHADAKTDGRHPGADAVSPPVDAGMTMDSSTGHDVQQMADTSRPPLPDGCVPILVDAGQGPACPATDASCGPKPASGFTATFVPPVARSSACTKTQINTFTGNCFNPSDAGESACSASDRCRARRAPISASHAPA